MKQNRMNELCGNCGRRYGMHIGNYCGKEYKTLFRPTGKYGNTKPEEPMTNKIQMTEEQAREILHECICTETCDLRLDAIIKVMKHKGYILLDPVEEAEEMYQEWLNREEDMSETLVMNKMCKAIQYLKAKLEVRHE